MPVFRPPGNLVLELAAKITIHYYRDARDALLKALTI